MKNIYVLPTDKPSRLQLQMNGKYHLENGQTIALKSFQNIYITSNEKFVRDEYVTDGIEVMKATSKLVNAQGLVDRRDWKKIILTTDQDLIKDGVQEITDVFLEWFIDNPECEYVEVREKGKVYGIVKGFGVKSFSNGYRIIIPKKEIKLEEVFNDEKREEVKEFIDTQKEIRRILGGLSIVKLKELNSFLNGVEYQYKKSNKKWSNEEVVDLLWLLYTSPNREVDFTTKEELIEWFNNHKKK